jgi:mannose/fructose/N-acetylgalactosamine-specific phosphotransferase system component IIC
MAVHRVVAALRQVVTTLVATTEVALAVMTTEATLAKDLTSISRTRYEGRCLMAESSAIVKWSRILIISEGLYRH